MKHRFKRAFTIEEAALIASDIPHYSSIVSAELSILERSTIVESGKKDLINEGVTSTGITWDYINEHEKESEQYNLALEIREALLCEVRIACQWHDYISGEAGFYEVTPNNKPLNDTCLEVFEIFRYGPNFPEASWVPNLKKTLICRISLAKWFEAFMPEKANLFDPKESYKTINTGHSIANIEASNTPKPTTKIVENSDAKRIAQTNNSQSKFLEKIIETSAWQNLYQLTENAVEEFPAWKESQNNPNIIPRSHIDEWLTTNLTVTKREAETIKKILVEIFNL